jgi:hypothetical protein
LLLTTCVLGHPADGTFRQQRPPEVGVQHHSGGVDHRPDARGGEAGCLLRHRRAEPCDPLAEPAPVESAGANFRAQGGELLADEAGDEIASVLRDRLPERLAAENLVDLREGPQNPGAVRAAGR